MVIASAGRTPGANGTFWQSDVTLFNTGTSRLTVTVAYTPSLADLTNRSASTSVAVDPNTTVAMSDIGLRLGVNNGSGSLLLTSSGSGLVATSRTYTSRADGGTFGQAIPPRLATAVSSSIVTGLRSDSFYRANIGLLNGGTGTIVVELTLLAANGSTVATASTTLPAGANIQASTAGFFPGVNAATLGAFTVRARTSSPSAMFAYASVIDNSSGDPIYIAGE
jgi:hypothetical protein